MKKHLILSLCFILFSCASSQNVERKVQNSLGLGKQQDPAGYIKAVPIEVAPPDPIIIEKPIYIPESFPATPPLQGRAAVDAANNAIVKPQDYSNSAMLYDYDRDFVYELYCRPFRVSDITLEPGEEAMEPPFVSDSERWMLGAGVSHEAGVAVQHIYVKPTASGLEASLIINTNRRVYHLILRSFSTVHMPIVRWRYHSKVMPQNYFASSKDTSPAAASRSAVEDDDENSYSADPRFLSFNYKITYGVFRKPRWLPTLAYDDGKKTYITFPDMVLMTEMPAVFEERANIVNYRVNNNVMIIDKLIEKITIKLGDRLATVEKQRGK